MKTKLLLTLCIINLTAFAQQWQWAYPIVSNTVTSIISVQTDSTGNPYFMGICDNSVTFNAKNGSFPVSGLSSFVAKYDAAGNKIWVSGSSGPTYSTETRSMSLDKHFNCYLTGDYSGTVSFGIGTDTLTRNSFQGSADYFLVKLDKNGKALFFNTAGGSCSDVGYTVTAFPNDEIVVFWQDQTFCNMAGTYISYMDKLNSNGTQLWSLLQPNPAYLELEPNEITPTTDGGFLESDYWFIDTICFNGILGNLCLNPPAQPNLSDVFLTKYTLNGDLQWVKAIRGNGYQFERAITTDSANNLIIVIQGYDTIYFGSSMMLPHDTTNTYLVKADAQGNLIQYISFPTLAVGHFQIKDLKSDRLGNIYLLGTPDTTIIIGSTTLTFNPNSLAVIKLDPNMNYLWSQYAYNINESNSGKMAITDSLVYVSVNYNASTVSLHGSTYQFPAPVDPTSHNCFFAAIKNDNPAVSTNTTSPIAHLKPEISISPNPSTGIFTVHSYYKETNTKICIYDLLGNCVFDKSISKNTNEQIDLSSITKGIYFVKLQTPTGMETRKIIIQ